MGMCASYVSSFSLALLITGEGNCGLQGFVAIAGALVGGVGSSILWVSQGTYFASAAQLFASKQGELVEDVTSRFGGNFAFAFLLFEVVLRLLSTFLIETLGLSWRTIFILYSLLSIIPAICMMCVMDVEGCQNNYNSPHLEEETSGEEDISWTQKATAALDLLRNDDRAKYLSPLSVLFGLSTSFGSSVLNGEVLRRVLSDDNSTFVGLYSAVTSMVAAGASLLFGALESSHGRFHVGKRSVLTAGASSYLIVASLFLAIPTGSFWNRTTLLFVYSMLGIGRATWEGTFRAVFADFFPNKKEGAFGSIILFNGSASTFGFILSVSKVLECDEVSKYCFEYRDGSIHNVLIMEVLVITMAVIAIPSFWRAWRLHTLIAEHTFH